MLTGIAPLYVSRHYNLPLRRLAFPYVRPRRMRPTEAIEGWTELIEGVYPRILSGVTAGAIRPPGRHVAGAAATAEMLVGLVYQALLQMGLSPLRRYLACHLVANAIDGLDDSPASVPGAP